MGKGRDRRRKAKEREQTHIDRTSESYRKMKEAVDRVQRAAESVVNGLSPAEKAILEKRIGEDSTKS